jgi:glutamyl-tRNA reductase
MRNQFFALASYHIKDFGVQGLTHIALPEKRLHEQLKEKLNIPGVNGLFYIQTCNRIEYLYSLSLDVKLEDSFDSLFPQITKRFYSDEKEIIDHLMSVCLSKDSLVFGENQILGQFKQAFSQANDVGLLNRDLHHLLKLVLQEAKRVRSECNFRHFPSSMSTLAAKRIQHTIRNDARILFVGAGETNELVARHLLKKNYKNFFWLNRTETKAAKMAESTAGTALSWAQLLQQNMSFDVIVTATSAGEILFDQKSIEKLGAKIAIDLSVPANIQTNENAPFLFFNVENFKSDLESVASESQIFLQTLNQKIIDSIDCIQQDLQLDRLAPLLAKYHQSQQELYEKHKLELERSLGDSAEKQKVLTWFEKTFKELSHQNLVEIKKALIYVRS